MRAIVRLARPKFLLYSWVLWSLGTAFAAVEGAPLDVQAYLSGLMFTWCAHLATHFCNEYFDQAADAANPAPTRWTGGSRILVEGLLEPQTACAAAFVLLFVSLGLALVMPMPARAYAFAAVTLGWFYTAPPFQLNYRGFGELTVATVLNLLVPSCAFALQAESHAPELVVLMVPAFLVQCVRMMVMNLADYEGDRQVGKRTSVVRLGPRRAAIAHAVGQATAYGLVVAMAVMGSFPTPAAVAILCTAPLAVWQSARVLAGVNDPDRANSVAFVASTHVALVIAATYAGVLFGAGARLWYLWLPLAALGVALAIQTRRELTGVAVAGRAPAPAARAGGPDAAS